MVGIGRILQVSTVDFCLHFYLKMSLLAVQQQSIVKSLILPKISQNRLPIVHILTSRTDNDDERVRLLFKVVQFLNSSYL